ncbi:MAG: 2-C-methyl-D-erythritol 2,4-cyclodiphosphate synthase [Oscillospiraceae bacterium]|nr:2-C-methyl-D-erythritol 2,4-cyclodiphosphate synthase [Oscillospiraceae bacterium]
MTTIIKATAILACGGTSTRMGENKLLIDLCGKSCILRSCEALANSPYVTKIIVSAPLSLCQIYSNELKSITKPITFVEGGATRQQSVKNAVMAADEDIVIIHDGARPLVSTETVNKSVLDACKFGSSVVCTPSKDTVRILCEGGSYAPNRSGVYIVRTPQTFKRELYLSALKASNADFTDDSQLLDSIGITPHITLGEYENIKLTTPEDIAVAKSILSSKEAKPMRIGHGYDVHKLVSDRKLILGGVEIEYEKGLLGHSDADVLTHAVMDSMLGAAALGDIGKLFPDNDPAYKGADSIDLLKEVARRVAKAGFTVSNIDVTVIAQKPKLAPYIDNMRERLANAIGIDISQISVKATTEEGLGFTGEGMGIAAHAVCLLG